MRMFECYWSTTAREDTRTVVIAEDFVQAIQVFQKWGPQHPIKDTGQAPVLQMIRSLDDDIVDIRLL